MADDSSFSTRIRKRVKYYFGVSNAPPFSSASIFSRAVADYAFLGYICVLIQQKTGSIKTAALISTIFECVSPFLDSFFERPSDRLMPYLITNLITDASFVAGNLMLWFIAPDEAQDATPDWSSGIFYLALALLAVGRTGELLTSRFLFHYISLGDDIIDVKNVLNRIDVWRSPARCTGAIVGLWISQFEDWKSIFKILSILTIIGYVFLICGILYYKCQKNERNPGETSNPSRKQINQSSQKCSLITQARQLLKLLLLYTPFLIYYVVEGAGKTLFYEPLNVLHDHIGKIFFDSASSLFAIQKGTGLMTKLLMEILTVTKLWKKSEQWQCAKLILGMFVCFCCCMCSWYVESQRMDLKPSMNDLWLVPQFALLGIAKELVEDGMHDIFFSHLKISMHLWVDSFICFLEGLGNALGAVFIAVLAKWIRDDIKESRLDKYYFLLAMLTILAILFFVCLWKFYAPKIKPKKDDKEDPKNDDKEGTKLRQLEEGKNFSRSHSPHPTESPAESTSKSSSNSDSSVVKRSLSYPDQPSNPAANVHYQRFHTHPKTNYEGITHQSTALSNLRPRLAAKSIHEPSDGCSEMN